MAAGKRAKRTGKEGYGIWQQRSFSEEQVYYPRTSRTFGRPRGRSEFAGGAATVENALPCLALLPRAACISMQDVSHDLGETLLGPEIAGGPDASRGGVWSAGRFRSFSAEEKATRFQGWLHLACVRSREVQAACKQTRGFTRDDVRTRGA